MQGRTSVVLTSLLFAGALIMRASMASAAELPEGVSVKVLAEFPSDIPGVEKIRLMEFGMEPGAKWEGFVEENTLAL